MGTTLVLWRSESCVIITSETKKSSGGFRIKEVLEFLYIVYFNRCVAQGTFLNLRIFLDNLIKRKIKHNRMIAYIHKDNMLFN